jgi:non-ribosomal peptide synthetase-like protein
MLGDEEVEGGWMTLRPTEVGRRSFIGNGAYVPDGTVVPDGVLIGVQSRTPENAEMSPGDTWLGSPPLRLPAREQAGGFDASLTFRPSLTRRLARGAIEAMRIVLPISVTIGFSYAIILDVLPFAEDDEWGKVAIHLALYGMFYGLSCLGLVAALKWMFIGAYRPAAMPMWSLTVWISEAITNLYESLAVPNCLEMLRGTPLLPWALRMMGARIGAGCWLDTTDLTEFDCVTIGDHATLNADSGPQTHLFEDRVMKIGRVDIGSDAVLHARAIVLYDATVGDRCELGPLTLIMKGERLPPRSRWCGSPAEPWQE